MDISKSCERYLQRYREHEIPENSHQAGTWQDVLVTPVYKESPQLLKRLICLPKGHGRTLVILVINHPDTQANSQINNAIRQASNSLAPAATTKPQLAIKQLNSHTDLYVHDLDNISGPIPASQGVGLARKIGCDIAFTWIQTGSISSAWMCSGDADAVYPTDYFMQLANVPNDRVAAVFPFRHVPGGEPACDAATALYELRLHCYRLGLEYAASPYAMHTLGSALAVKASSYAQVRGFPKRSGGEDFYLLNKLAKVGAIESLCGNTIDITSRISDRIPFGTGPAVGALCATGELNQQPLFYHPDCFLALRGFLQTIELRGADLECEHLEAALAEAEMDAQLREPICRIGKEMGLSAALEHCRRQSTCAAQYLRQFHQWFDGFRTLKFIHGIRDAGRPMQSFDQLCHLTPNFLPPALCASDVESRLQAIRQHWAWKSG
ncbi:MAG: hypothetical protein AAF699_08225 [Pseudomonadota bacterium]